ncbi:jg3991, partial [Pararge aegeria aegeria]
AEKCIVKEIPKANITTEAQAKKEDPEREK